jgi:hypothetical protein
MKLNPDKLVNAAFFHKHEHKVPGKLFTLYFYYSSPLQLQKELN